MKSFVFFSSFIICCHLFMTTSARSAGNHWPEIDFTSADSSGKDYGPKVRPDPENSSIIITFLSDSLTSIQLKLYNILGQQVEEWHTGSLEPGIHRIVLTHPGLNTGVYFVSFQTSSRRVIRKVLYVR